MVGVGVGVEVGVFVAGMDAVEEVEVGEDD